MSFEYSLEFSGGAPISAIVSRLVTYGLMPKAVGPDGAVLTYADTPEHQLLRWGGDVEISTTNTGLLVTINGKGHQQVLRLILEELAAQGLSVVVDEP
jgi:hypothetical protein